MRHKKITALFFRAELWGGGAEKVTLDICRYLDKSRFNPVIWYAHQNDAAAWNMFRGIILESPLLPNTLRLPPRQTPERFNFYAGLLTERLKQLEAPTVLIPASEGIFPALAQALENSGRRGVPCIVQSHAYNSYLLPIIYSPQQIDLFTRLCREANFVTSPSQGCRDDLCRNFASPKESTLHIPNPVDFELIEAMAARPCERPLPEAAKNKHLFLCMARYAEQKNHALLLRACTFLREKNPEFYLLCVGEGSLRGELQVDIENLGLTKHISLFGAVENPFPYYSLAQTHVLASVWESFGLVLVEALACACPCIATNTLGSQDVLNNGRGGIITPQNDPEALAQAMLCAMEQPDAMREKRSRAQEWIKLYDIKKIVPQWENLIESCF
ncbi:MAG: glycosyltransferase [Deltaproteobacteria bacterium]|jgi:glycosyltransferase involved in cell wall biosynthesis|nr:glycosyltransferase [Deltaproteobacteria bacterium]